MHVYAITGVGFYGTQSLCHAAAREVTSPDPEIVLIDIEVDKASILAILNGEPLPFTLIKSFEITPRGGMVEIDEAKKTALDQRREIRQEPPLRGPNPFDIWNAVFEGSLIRPEAKHAAEPQIDDTPVEAATRDADADPDNGAEATEGPSLD